MKNCLDSLALLYRRLTAAKTPNIGSINCARRLSALLTLTGSLLFVSTAPAVTNTWSGGGGADDNWSTAANWDTGAPTAGSDVLFTPTDATATSGWSVGGGTPNNIIDTNFTLNTLWSRPTNAWHVTQIPAGTNLTITGAMAVTNLTSLGTNYYAIWVGSQNNLSLYHTILGQGTLAVNNTNSMVMVRNVFTTSPVAAPPTLDMSGLDTFTANVIGVSVGGDGTVTATANDRPTGILYLAKTNIVTSSSTVQLRPLSLSGLVLTIGDSIVSVGTQSKVYLGDTNVFLGDSGIAVGWRRGQGLLQFRAPGTGGVAFFRNRAGTGRQSYWGVGDDLTGSTGNLSDGTADFTGGTVDAMVDTMYVGRGTGASSGVGTGRLYIGNGLMDVNSLDIGTQKANPGGAGKGTVTTTGGAALTNLIVNGNLRLGLAVGGAGATATFGTISIDSAVVVKGNVVGGDSGASTLTLNTGSLSVGGRLGNNGGANDKPINTLNLVSGTLNLSLGSAGNPITPVCNTSNLNVSAITLNVDGTGLSPGVIPVMKWYTSGSFAGITYGTLPPKTSGYYSNTTDTLYLVLTVVDSPKWNGATNGVANGNWDINATANWLGGSSGAPTIYQQATIPGDAVLFDDTATGTTTVNLTTTLSPTAITVNNSAKAYAFGGTGGLSGTTGLTKQGSGVLTLENTGTNSFSGPVTIGGGTLRLSGSADRLPTNAVVTLSDATGVVLDVNGQNQWLRALAGGGTSGGDVSLGAGTLTLSGNGSEFAGIIGGDGAVIKTNSGTQILSGANTYGGGTIIYGGTLTVANATGSGIGNGNLRIAGGTLQLGNGGAAGSIGQGTITNNGTLAINRSDDLVFTNLVTGTGGLSKLAMNNVTIPGTNNYTGSTSISEGGLLTMDAGALGSGSSTVNIGSSQLSRLMLSNNIALTHPIGLSSKGGALNAPPHVENLGGTNTLSGPIAGGAGGTDWSFQSDDGKLIVTGAFSNITSSVSQILNLRGAAWGEWYGRVANGSSPSFVVALTKWDAGTWTLAASSTNTYTGLTTIKAGTLVVDGAILGSSGVVLNSGATLAGSGLIACPVTNAPSAFISPGNASIGTLTISNKLVCTFNSACVFDVSDSGCDSIRGLSTVEYSGNLQVVLNGSLSKNAVFKLFDATNYQGAFDFVDVPSLPPPLTWDTTHLTADGTVRVTGGPEISSFGLASDRNFQLSGTGAADQPYRILATTNVADPSSWSEVGSGTFAGGVFSFTDLSSTNYPRRFYQVVTP
jgi:fibronectin-binding autotransporter adhesin